MKNKYILTIDQSTSGSKVMLVDNNGDIIIKKSKEHQQYYPKPGWVEHDSLEIYKNVLDLIKEVLSESNIDLHELVSLAITNQRETVLLWDKDSGKPVYNAIVWQCSRTVDICNKLSNSVNNKMIKSKTGLLLDPYFSATKIKWIIENIAEARESLENDRLMAGTIDSWLIWKLTKGQVHATDYTNASRTLLFNIKTLSWDQDLIRLFGLDGVKLPRAEPSDNIFAYTDLEGILPGQIPITGVIGDSQGALFGQKCFEKGMAKATYGTGTSVLLNIGEDPIFRDDLVTSIAWGIQGKVFYVFEGIIRSTGDTLRWVKDNLGIFTDFAQVEQLIGELNDNEGVYLVPAFSGLGAPYWDMEARAAIIGMTKKTDRRHIIRAAVESTAYQITDVINLMVKSSGIELKILRTDGGAITNKFLMNFQAGLLKRKVSASQIAELSALGAAYISGISVGVWNSQKDINGLNSKSDIYIPKLKESLRIKYYDGWNRAVSRSLQNKI